MKHDATVEYDALAWVKPELDALLDRARQSLEAYVEDETRDDLLTATAQVLRQVRGTLQVVDLSGAVMLAEEMERLIEELGANRIKNRETALGVLSAAVLQLPDYLEYVQSGHPDTPIVILPLLNDLRASREAELLSEKLVFVPDIEVDAESLTGTDEGEQRTGIVKSKRHSFQLGLLSVFRDQQQAATLERMIDVLGDLEDASHQSALKRLWWVGSALIETLDESPIPIALKLLLGRLDRTMREILQQGESATAKALPPDLLKNLLYYVARAEKTGPRVEAVREAFHLDDLLPTATRIETARQELSAPNVKLLETVGNAIREDLAEVRDQLEIYTHSDDTQSADFKLVAERLRKISDTLSILGLNEARDQVAAQAAQVDAAVNNGTAVDNDVLLALAEAMLNTEQALQYLLRRRRDGTSAASVAGEVTAAGVREALRELTRVKDALLAYFANPSEHRSELAAAPKVLTDIMAALSLIGVEPPVERMRAIAEHIRGALHTDREMAQEWKNSLADAITAVEMYMESRTGQRPEQQAFLGRADEALARLGPVRDDIHSDDDLPPGAGAALADEARTSSAELPDALDFTEDAAISFDEIPQEAEDTALTLADDVMAQNTAQEDDLITVAELDIASPISSPEQTQVLPVLKVKPGRKQLSPVRKDADPEILDIFLEEAQEEVERIGELLPKWKANHADEEALASIRRSFHTLKGSGRLAGAELMGEFAWAFESMLNRIIDQTIELRDEHFTLLESALEALKQITAQLINEAEPTIDFLALMDAAEAASKDEEQPGELEDVPLPSAALSPDVLETQVDLPTLGLEGQIITPPPPPAQGHIDPGLLDIFTREVHQHLSVIEEVVTENSGSSGPLPISDDLVIALHTLNGSSRTADIPRLYAMFSPLEAIAVRLRETGRPLPQSMLGLYQDVVAATESTLGALSEPGAELPDTSGLVRRIEETLENLDVGLAPLSTDSEEGETRAMEVPEFSRSATLSIEETAEAFEEEPEVVEEEPVEPLPPPVPAASPSVGTPDMPDALDSELVSIFLDEGDELMTGADSAIQSWESGQGAFEAIETLQRDLHTLKGGARMAGFKTIGDLTHGLETLIMRLAEQGGAPQAEGLTLLHAAVDQLGDMLQQARNQQPVYPQAELIDRLARFRPQGTAAGIEPERAAPVVSREAEPAVVTPEPPAPQAPEMTVVGKEAPVTVEERAPERTPDRPATQAADEVLRSDALESDTPAFSQPAATAPTPPSMPKQGQGSEQVRVRADLLDSLVNYAGEVNIYHARLQQQISGFGFNLGELRQTVNRLRDQLRKLELETEAQILYRFQMEQGEEGAPAETEARTDFDPLELDRYSNIQQLSRALAESLSDLSSIEQLLAEEVRDTETLLLQQQRVSTDLQDGLMRSRMVQFGGLAPRLRRIVRQTASELGKQAELQLAGENSEVDRSVLDRLIAPLEHMLRNAVAHGLESAAERQAAGKPEVGKINVSVSREGSEVVVVVQDDGRGISVPAVRAKAVRLGLIPPNAQLDDKQVTALILESGFSTAEQVSQISGRGVGMDVVVSEIKQLGGVLSIDSQSGRGTRFVVRLPFTLTITQALLAQVGEHLYALPLSGVEGVVRMKIAELRSILAQESPSYDYLGTHYDVRPLETLLGANPSGLPEQDDLYYPLLLIRSGELHVAVQVDNLIGSREVVVKTLGSQFANLHGVAGATILGDGRVVLILDTAGLVRMSVALGAGSVAAAVVEETESHRPLIMVVDDSITIRKVTSRVLERNGFDVMTARDGMDAIAQLEERKPDLMLTDIEMPRMDGYELSSHVRNDSRYRDMPIIMITSRSGEKHRLRAQELGVDRYLGKPYQEMDLLDSIRELLRARV